MIREHRRPREVAGAAGRSEPSTSATAPATLMAAAPAGPDGAADTALGMSPSLSTLPIAGFTRRRLAWIVAALVAGWILFTFARQVGEAADATARADRVRAENATISADLARLTAELAFIQDPRFVAQQARAYGIGSRKERPFTLAADASPLPADAAGSETRRIGYREVVRTPLEAWVQLLFGSGPSP